MILQQSKSNQLFSNDLVLIETSPFVINVCQLLQADEIVSKNLPLPEKISRIAAFFAILFASFCRIGPSQPVDCLAPMTYVTESHIVKFGRELLYSHDCYMQDKFHS